MRLARLLCILAPVLLLSAVLAHADTVTSFVLSGMSDFNTGSRVVLPGNPISGEITIDVTTGVVESINLNEPVYDLTVGGTYFEVDPDSLLNLGEYWQEGYGSGDFINLYLPVTTLVGYEGGSVCSADDPCPDYSISDAGYLGGGPVISAELNPGYTPEPPSWILSVTGVLVMLGLARQRLCAVRG